MLLVKLPVNLILVFSRFDLVWLAHYAGAVFTSSFTTIQNTLPQRR